MAAAIATTAAKAATQSNVNNKYDFKDERRSQTGQAASEAGQFGPVTERRRAGTRLPCVIAKIIFQNLIQENHSDLQTAVDCLLPKIITLSK